MSEHSMVFPAAEFQSRTDALQRSMAKQGTAALLLTGAADIFYVTGFLTRFWESPARPWFVIMPAAGKPVAVIPSIGADLMRRTWIGDIRTWDAPDPEDDGISLLADTLTEIAGDKGAVGIPMGLETQLRMPLGDFSDLTRRLGVARFTDATDIVQRVREVKSEAEIDRIRTICAVADCAFARVPEIAAPDEPLNRVFREFQMLLLQEGADWVSYVAGAAGPGGYGDVISPADASPLQVGDVLMLDTGAVRDGYFCDFDRNFAIGQADDAAKWAHAALFDATEIALEQLRPGMRASDLHRILTGAIRANGATPGGGRLGHGLGVTLTEWPSVTAKDHTVLREGMVLTLEPGVVITPGRIMVHEENIVLRESGAELLSTRTTPDLPVIPV